MINGEERFWSKVHKLNPCWVWTASTDRNGYGKLRWKGQIINAHRVSWEIANGSIPEGMCVLHTCDNKPCVNPDHLFLGTQNDNMKDMAKKGRSPRGETHSCTRLTDDQVRAVRVDTRTQTSIAATYGISQSLVSLIKLRKRRTRIKEIQ